MIKNTQIYLAVLLSILLSCDLENTPVKKQQATAQTKSLSVEPDNLGKPIYPAAGILGSFNSFWNYYSSNIQLYADFKPSNSLGKVITKGQFLKAMQSGLYFPLALHSSDNISHYQLAKIPRQADAFISDYMRKFSTEELIHYEMEGKRIPKFSLTAIDGTQYTSENTMGKTLVFKCWFIACVACVKEMPALNELVESYTSNPNVLFISLASDSKSELQTFLRKTTFNYATVPNQKSYMENDLRVNSYPTHFLIDKSGLLVKVLPDEKALATALAKEVAKDK
jgi:peroxiredoxin